ncbi:MAG: hypothetical protein ACI4GD_10840 [Lachnospiraceae bacterium]
MVIIFVIVLLLLVVLGGFFFCQYIVKYGTLDKNGMENPNYADYNGEMHMVDGDYTYVDNGALMEIVEGVWNSEDGHYSLTFRQDSSIELVMDGEKILESTVQFTYLQPGKPRRTDFELDNPVLTKQDGTACGNVTGFYYEPDEKESLVMCVSYYTNQATEGGETIVFANYQR